MINFCFYLLGCVASFIIFWFILYFEHYLVAKYVYKINTVEFNITIVDIIASIFLTALSFIGILVEFFLFLILIINVLLNYIYEHRENLKVIKKIKINYHWYDKHR